MYIVFYVFRKAGLLVKVKEENQPVADGDVVHGLSFSHSQ
jgi:hypothetical protein